MDYESPKYETPLVLVDFTAKRWIHTHFRSLNLFDTFVDVDENVAEFIMRANSVPGVSTKYCCAGHYGTPWSAYVYFNSITDDFAKRMDSVKHMRMDENARKQGIIVYRATWYYQQQYPVASMEDLLTLHSELLKATADIHNGFTRMDTKFVYANHSSNLPSRSNGDDKILDIKLVEYYNRRIQQWTTKPSTPLSP